MLPFCASFPKGLLFVGDSSWIHIHKFIIDAVDKLHTSVVKIEQFTGDKGRDTVTGTGTGFLFSSDGYLFTNSHVVKKAKQLRAMLYEGTVHHATLIGEDPYTDLAILK